MFAEQLWPLRSNPSDRNLSSSGCIHHARGSARIRRRLSIPNCNKDGCPLEKPLVASGVARRASLPLENFQIPRVRADSSHLNQTLGPGPVRRMQTAEVIPKLVDRQRKHDVRRDPERFRGLECFDIGPRSSRARKHQLAPAALCARRQLAEHPLDRRPVQGQVGRKTTRLISWPVSCESRPKHRAAIKR